MVLRGEPSWSLLYRQTIRVLTDGTIRCVVPDLVRFGRSDKPVHQSDYSYAWPGRLDSRTGLRPPRPERGDHVGQDRGGLIGLRLVAEHPDRFSRVVAANTGLPTGDFDMPEMWWQFRRAVEKTEVLDISRLIAAGCVRSIADDVRGTAPSMGCGVNVDAIWRCIVIASLHAG